MTSIQPEPNPIIMLPFAVLLLALALVPIVLRHHWEKHHPKICAGLAAITSSYYVFAQFDDADSECGLGIPEFHGGCGRILRRGRRDSSSCRRPGFARSMIPVLDYMERHAGVKTPSFFGFVFKFALPVLIPIFVLVSFLFFR